MDILTPLIEKFSTEISPARMLESIILLGLIWRKLSPHLTKIENRIAGLEAAVREGFKSGELRFERIETRVTTLEQTKE
jgi:hypothetical protein